MDETNKKLSEFIKLTMCVVDDIIAEDESRFANTEQLKAKDRRIAELEEENARLRNEVAFHVAFNKRPRGNLYLN